MSNVQEQALARALKAHPGIAADAAAVALARRLAQLIDRLRGDDHESALMIKLAPEYLRALTALGLTPAARTAQQPKEKGTIIEHPVNPLQQARDAARARRAAAGDPASP